MLTQFQFNLLWSLKHTLANLKFKPLACVLSTLPQASTAPSFKSKYVGVTWNRVGQKWAAKIGIEGKINYLGNFLDEVDAARAFDARAAPLGMPLNFPGPGQTQAAKKGTHGIKSRYTGVCWSTRDLKWRAQITIGGKGVHLGYFKNEKAAARMFDERAGPLGRPVNFPTNDDHKKAKKTEHRSMKVFAGILMKAYGKHLVSIMAIVRFLAVLKAKKKQLTLLTTTSSVIYIYPEEIFLVRVS